MRKNLMFARKEKQLTQAELAKTLGVTQRHYNRLEAGTSNGAIPVWEKLKQITGKPIDYLLQQADETERR